MSGGVRVSAHNHHTLTLPPTHTTQLACALTHVHPHLNSVFFSVRVCVCILFVFRSSQLPLCLSVGFLRDLMLHAFLFVCVAWVLLLLLLSPASPRASRPLRPSASLTPRVVSSCHVPSASLRAVGESVWQARSHAAARTATRTPTSTFSTMARGQGGRERVRGAGVGE